MTIGIPQSLIYFKKPYFWEAFFKSLDFKVLLSPLTNKQIVASGVKIADPETCFSNKVYWGHLVWLDGKGCDLIFVPRLKTNKEKLEYCPKFFALPDLAKILVKTPILTKTFDEKKESFKRSLEKLGKKLGKNSRETRKAFDMACLEEKDLKEKERQAFARKMSSEKQKIVLISHPYNLYDDYVNLSMKERLEKLGVEPIFLDEVPNSTALTGSLQQSMLGIEFHWEFGKEIFEKIEEILKYNITGVIEVSSFACGCDAVLKEFIEKEFKNKNIPFLYLMIDEHTGEAGFQTRLEAFVDTICLF